MSKSVTKFVVLKRLCSNNMEYIFDYTKVEHRRLNKNEDYAENTQERG